MLSTPKSSNRLSAKHHNGDISPVSPTASFNSLSLRSQNPGSYSLAGHGTIRFNGFGQEASANAPYLIVRTPTKPVGDEESLQGDYATVRDAWRFMRKCGHIEEPKMIISVTGGARRFFMKKRLLDSFKRGLMLAATAANACIVTGGTQSGVMELVGQAVRDYMLQNGSYEQNLVVLGIAPLGIIINNKELKDRATEVRLFPVPTTTFDYNMENVGKAKPQHSFLDPVEYNFDGGRSSAKQSSFLDPHHTHFILVDDGTEQGSFGTEIDFRAKFESRKHKDLANIPVVTLVLEGGPNTLKTAAEAIENNTAVVAFAGSGRAADFIAAAYDKKDEATVRSLAQKLNANKDGKFDEKKVQESIDLVNKMLMPETRHLLTIYRSRGESKDDIDQEILNAVLKAYGMKMDQRNDVYDSWERCVHLAMAWNKPDVARHSIFNAENRSHWQDGKFALDDALFEVLADDKDEFVLLFLDSGANLRKFVTEDRLGRLYDETLDKSGIIGRLIRNLIDHSEVTYCQCFNRAQVDTDAQHTLKAVSRLLNKLTGNLYVQLITNEQQQVDCPERELFVWAILFNRMQMARIFWKGCRDHVGAALLANKLLKSLADEANKREEFQMAKQLEDSAKEFEQAAIGVLDECYKTDQSMAQQLLVRLVDLWGRRTLFSISDAALQMDFMVHDCCQTKLTKIWYGGMAVFSSVWMILLAIPFPFFFLPFIEFETDESHPFNDKVAAADDGTGSEVKIDRNLDGSVSDMNDDESVTVSRGCRKCATSPRMRRVYKAWQKTTNFYKAPFVKFVCHTLSYLFLVGLFSYFIMIELSPGTGTIIEYIIWGWSATLFLELVREIFTREEIHAGHKLSGYFSDAFHSLQLAMYVLLVISIILRFTLNEDNFMWARNLYTITVVIYYLRILQLFFVHRNLGPKVIMIREMLKDIVFFLFLLFVFMFAYGVASQALMYPNSEANWTLLYNVVYYTYYAVYQQYPMDQLLGQVADCSNNYTVYTNDPSVPRCSINSWLNNVLFSAYILIIGIMLLNILIAIFSYTFNTVQDNSEKTWSFYRYSLTKEYHDKPTLVPPFIIFNHIWRVSRRLCYRCNPTFITRNDFIRNTNVEMQKRLTAFEKAGMENYLHSKRAADDSEIDAKTAAAVTKLDTLLASSEVLKEGLIRLTSPAPAEREMSMMVREPTNVATFNLETRKSFTMSKEEQDKDQHHHHHRRHRKDINEIKERMGRFESQLVEQNSKLDAILRCITPRTFLTPADPGDGKVPEPTVEIKDF